MPKERIDWVVRPATEEDEEAAGDLLWKSYSTLFPNDYDARLVELALPKLTSPRPELLRCGTWYLVVHPETGQVVGCGGWTRESPRGSDSPPHLRHFATDPSWTRCGVASAIWGKILDDIEQDPNVESDCDLEVFSSLSAESFYKSLGFEVVQRFDLMIGKDCPFPSILMERKMQRY